MKGPSIAVMLGHPEHEEEDGVGLSHGESKSAGADAGKALISAIKAGDGEAAYRAVCAMNELHESGEEEDYAKPEDTEGEHEGLKEDEAGKDEE